MSLWLWLFTARDRLLYLLSSDYVSSYLFYILCSFSRRPDTPFVQIGGDKSYETSRLKPTPSCPSFSSSYNDGLTSVADGLGSDILLGDCNRSWRQSDANKVALWLPFGSVVGLTADICKRDNKCSNMYVTLWIKWYIKSLFLNMHLFPTHLNMFHIDFTQIAGILKSNSVC